MVELKENDNADNKSKEGGDKYDNNGERTKYGGDIKVDSKIRISDMEDKGE